MGKKIIQTRSEEESLIAGENFAKELVSGSLVTISGDLGTGKTVFIKGICKFFEVEELVTSPTFSIMNQYNGLLNEENVSIFHIDLYRINTIEELKEIGLWDCLTNDDSIKLIEWPEKANGFLPIPRYDIKIIIDVEHENNRTFEISYLS